ncbi:hypothetical protein [uncultured Fibrobacter sp.]|uniref:hypothetical protein n=1 Tax=uncultured Fibrobacter sp. TaxID=261512 RepID=UPI002604D250|nr:hypothetical protein [uncultured Fibrobacter sp.]
MKKVMFNDRYGLTAAVLRGEKTQTRRDATRLVEAYWNGRKLGDYPTLSLGEYVLQHATNNVGDVVAVAQKYKELYPYADFGMINTQFMTETPGWTNKMFVKAELMFHYIKITRVRLQLLQDISENDCLREGVEKWLDSYIVTGIMERNGKNNYCFTNPRDAYSVLIDRISGKGTWERNPYVIAYDFELVTK